MNAKRTALLLWLDQFHLGLTWTAIKEWHGGTDSAIHALLRRMRKDGHIAFCSDDTCHGKWHTPRHLQTVLQAYLREKALRYEGRRRKRAAYEKLRHERRKKEQSQAREAAASSWSNTKPEHRVVKAQDAAPLRKPCASSVWELAS